MNKKEPIIELAPEELTAVVGGRSKERHAQKEANRRRRQLERNASRHRGNI